MSIFKLSTGQKANVTTEAELGGSSEPIPEGTKLKAIITESSWDKNKDGERYINNRWDCVEGEFKGRVVFQKIRVNLDDEKKRDKHINMLAAIDNNCGGKLQELDGEPTDMQLTKALTNKPMIIRVGVWEMNDGKGNWVQSVQSAKGETKAKAKVEEPKASSDLEEFDDDVGF